MAVDALISVLLLISLRTCATVVGSRTCNGIRFAHTAISLAYDFSERSREKLRTEKEIVLECVKNRFWKGLPSPLAKPLSALRWVLACAPHRLSVWRRPQPFTVLWETLMSSITRVKMHTASRYR